MDKIRLGKTDLIVSRSGFGALPIQRIAIDDAVTLLNRAFDGGIDFYDTARYYSDSEEKIGKAFRHNRRQVTIATKAMGTTRSEVVALCEESLVQLGTEYVDLLQLHNPSHLPNPDDPESGYAGLVEAQKKGMARYIGITCHQKGNAIEAAMSQRYDTVQYPLSPLSTDDELSLSKICDENGCGLIAMKALGGGLITNVAASFSFLRQYNNTLPIWGLQTVEELNTVLALESDPPELDSTLLEVIDSYRRELSGKFCRGCGYCLPCPQGIEINWVARMSLLLRRAPTAPFYSSVWREKMERIKKCTECGACRTRCPYNLDTPLLLKQNLADYIRFRSN